jgi:hypothetical protein
MMPISEFGIRNSECRPPTPRPIEQRVENPKSEIRNPKSHCLGGEA